jgi:hypothetical protein
MSFGRPVSPESVTIGLAIPPNATGAVFATSDRRRLQRREPERDQHHAADRHGRPEAGQRLQQRAEAERDDQRLDALVAADGPERALEHGEMPRVDRHVVDPQRVEEDQHDGEQPEHGALRRRQQRLVARHRVDGDREHDRHGQRAERGPVRPQPEAAQQDEQHDQRDRGDERRQT